MDVARVVSSSKQDLPDYHGHGLRYEYEPRPPKAGPPLVDPREYKFLLSECSQDCLWRILPWHECINFRRRSTYLKRIPKIKNGLTEGPQDVSSKTGESTAFGIEADYVLCFEILAVYHLLLILPSFIFWAYWMAKHPGDLQNASVPSMTVFALITVLWIILGKRVGIS